MFGKQKPAIFFVLVWILLASPAAIATVEAQPLKAKGQTVYVPIYSHIFTGHGEQRFHLAATLSIRNTDPNQAITVVAVDYYDTRGKRIKTYLEGPVSLDRLATTRYLVEISNKTGGSGANFLVQWQSASEANVPIIEAIMIGTQSGQGISFTSRGQVIDETN